MWTLLVILQTASIAPTIVSNDYTTKSICIVAGNQIMADNGPAITVSCVKK
jgi:hypothetical protein